MNNKIELLDATLLGEATKLKEITHWLRVMNRPNGWHYDLDIVWILNELEKAGIKPGATIVDAGAGQGIMQYLLASHGYKVISLDFSPRKKPLRSIGIFDIEGDGHAKIEYEHSYMKFISYGITSKNQIINRTQFIISNKIFELPHRMQKIIISFAEYLRERFLCSHRRYGKIIYLRAPFHEVPLESNSVDAVISLSAIEHADINLFEKNIGEFLRIIKKGAPLLITTSATPEAKNTYHEKTSGWCFSISTLKNFFPGCIVNFNIPGCVQSLIESSIFRSRLDPYYYKDSDSFCFRKKIKYFPYLPVAIKIVK